MKPLVSVIVATHNRAEYLALTLASLETQSFRDFEIVVVNDGGADNTDEVISAARQRLQIRYQRIAHLGRGAARNRAVEMARGTLLVFCDDDRLAASRFLEDHVACHARSKALVMGWRESIITIWSQDLERRARQLLLQYPAIALQLASSMRAARCQRLSADMLRCRPAEQLADMYGFGDTFTLRRVKPFVEQFGEELEGCHVAWVLVTTANLSAPKAYVERVGGFETSFRGWGLEDTELGYRLLQEGLRPVLTTRATNYHQLHTCSATRMDDWMANLRRMQSKHADPVFRHYEAFVQGSLDLKSFNELAAR